MPTDNNSNSAPTTEEQLGFIATPTTGTSELEGKPNTSSMHDPNARAMNENAEAAQQRQLTGEPPASSSPQGSAGLPAPQSPEFEDGT